MEHFYQQSVDAIARHVATDIKKGLSKQEARERLKRNGPNALPHKKPRSLFFIFLSQFQSPLIYLLVFAAILIFFISEDHLDAFIISGVLIFNAIIGTIQEDRTTRIVESLKQFIETTSVVIRDGEHMIVEDKDLVVGDIIILKEGERVPADARVIESHNVQVDQSILTGESMPVRKSIEQIKGEVPLAVQNTMVFKGTYVITGAGKALVTATGVHTEIGKIHTVIEEIHTEVPLRKEVDRLSYLILFCVLFICAALFIVGYSVGKPLQELFVMLTALFICVVPEGLPVVLTLVLVSGVYRMAKQSVLVKNMQAVETLGRTDVIVVDKTGTLTRNELMVTQVYTDNMLYMVSGRGYHNEGIITRNGHRLSADEMSPNLKEMATIATLLNTAQMGYDQSADLFSIKGDPTEAALYVFAQKVGIDRASLHQYTRLYEIPFDSSWQYHASIYKKNDRSIHAYMLGAPEVIQSLSKTTMPNFKEALNTLVNQGARAIAVASSTLSLSEFQQIDPQSETAHHDYITLISNTLTCIGLFGLEDSIRSEIKYVIAQARAAGLHIVMATGDHQKTARHVSEYVGIYSSGDTMLDGPDMDALNDAALAQQAQDVTVYSRVTPLHKMRIINALHARGAIVAMTGDGVNDAPSLVAADLGIAMGRIGTEVAKQASDIILLNDSLVSIIHAIEQGRHIFYTLKRVILYFFATNMGEILIVLFALTWELLLGQKLPLPITAAQILWLNLVTDGFLDIALSMEPQEPGMLSKQWLRSKPQLIDWALVGKMFFFAIPMAVVSLLIFLSYYQTNIAYARTMTLITMAMFQWFNAWNCRSNTKSIVQLGFFSNKWLIVATSFVLILQLCIVYIPFLQYIFKTVPLGLLDWALIFGCTFPIVIIEEIRKWIVRIVRAY